MKNYYSLSETAEMLSVSKQTLRRWDENGKLKATRMPNTYRVYSPESLKPYVDVDMIHSVRETTEDYNVPIKSFSVLELFAGAGGLALGLEKQDCLANY